MPTKRFFRLPDAKQQVIISAALVEFAEHGYADTSVKRIVETTGSSKGGLYYWFDDKQDLFCYVSEHALDPLWRALGKPGPVGSSEGFWSAVGAMLNRGARYLENNDQARNLLIKVARAHTAGELDTGWAELAQPARNIAKELILLGQDMNAVRVDLPLPILTTILLDAAESVGLCLQEQAHDEEVDEETSISAALLDVTRRIAAP